jgi:hypothetical protein
MYASESTTVQVNNAHGINEQPESSILLVHMWQEVIHLTVHMLEGLPHVKLLYCFHTGK